MKAQSVRKNKKGAPALATPADAVLAIAIMTVLADGKLHRREMDFLKNMLFTSPLFDKVPQADMYLRGVAAAIAEAGRDKALEQAAALLGPTLRETAYAWAVYQVVADGKFVPDEYAFLALLKKKLGLHGALCGKIKAVIPMLVRVR